MLGSEAARAALPPPDLTISEWANEYGVLSAESSAEPGRWHTYSYQAAMMDAFVTPEIERIVVMKSARIGWTKILGHVIGYHIHLDSCSMLIVQPTIEDAEGWSKEELTPMIEDTPVLLERVGDQKSRSTGNTISKKHYPGGILHAIGANSPRGFRRITVRLTEPCSTRSTATPRPPAPRATRSSWARSAPRPSGTARLAWAPRRPSRASHA